MKSGDMYISRNQIAGAVAASLLRDLCINNFCFYGIPEVQISELQSADDHYRVSLRVNLNTVQFSLSVKDANDAAISFQFQQQPSSHLIKLTQTALRALEALEKNQQRLITAVVVDNQC